MIAPPVNFIPRARLRVAASRKAVRHAVTALLAYGVAITVVAAALALGRAAPQPEPTRSLDDIQLATERARARQAEAKARLTAADATLERMDRALGNPDWSLLLHAIAAHTPDTVIIDSIELNASRAPQPPPGRPRQGRRPVGSPKPPAYALTITGVAPSALDASTLVLNLETSRLFDAVVQRETRSRPVRGVPAVGFRIECTLRDPAEVNP
ncbi:MAG: PilN domain-containing protein [Phycisphaeraceae bacterium]|nr:MAG: PilN domain-containing protein [Phycisphaeraceae bacterium]